MEELKKEIYELKEEIKKLKSDSDNFKTENDNLKKENETLKTSVDTFKKSISEKKVADISEFVLKLIESGKITADKKEALIAHFSSITSDIFTEEQIKADIVYSTIMTVQIAPEVKNSKETLPAGSENTQKIGVYSDKLGVTKESYEAFEKSTGLKF